MSKLQVDTIVDKEDKSAPTFSKGVIVTGVTTASGGVIGNVTGDVTGTLSGTASGLAGSPDITVGSVTAGGQVIVGASASPYDTRSVTIQPLSGQTNTYLSVIGGNTTAVAGITFGDDAGQAAGNYAGMVEYLNDGDYLLYKQNNSEKLRIDPAGNVNISGIVTATSYSGDGSALTGISAGGYTEHVANQAASGSAAIEVTSGLSDSTKVIKIIVKDLNAGNANTGQLIQLGTSSAYAGTYNAISRYNDTSGSNETTNNHDGTYFHAWVATSSFENTNRVFSGVFTLTRIGTGNYIMESTSLVERTDNDWQALGDNHGRVELGGTLSKIKIYTGDGSNFSAGNVTILSM